MITIVIKYGIYIGIALSIAIQIVTEIKYLRHLKLQCKFSGEEPCRVRAFFNMILIEVSRLITFANVFTLVLMNFLHTYEKNVMHGLEFLPVMLYMLIVAYVGSAFKRYATRTRP